MHNQITTYSQNWLFIPKKIKTFSYEKVLLLFAITLTCLMAISQKQCDQIKLNQVGYYPNSSKLAFLTCNVRSREFYIVSADGTDTVFEGTLVERKKSSYSSTTTTIADFSLLTAWYYILRIDDKQSFPFEIKTMRIPTLAKMRKFFYHDHPLRLRRNTLARGHGAKH